MVMENNNYESFLSDVGYEIKAKARDARRLRDEQPPASEMRSIQLGRAVALAEVISILQHYAVAMEIPLSRLQLDDIDPDAELL